MFLLLSKFQTSQLWIVQIDDWIFNKIKNTIGKIIIFILQLLFNSIFAYRPQDMTELQVFSVKVRY